MIEFENCKVVGWEAAIRGMRNPMNSWEMSDTIPCYMNENCPGLCEDNLAGIHIGENDHYLMMKLRNAGTDHRKYMRMITVYVDITAPLYWWKEFDTYKVGTVANSCSTMHKIYEKEFTVDDFSCEHLIDIVDCEDGIEGSDGKFVTNPSNVLQGVIDSLNVCRNAYLETRNKKYWWQMIQLLPSSYNQKRTVMLNYEVLANIYKSRKVHKLDEWSIDFRTWIESLPYSELITDEN